MHIMVLLAEIFVLSYQNNCNKFDQRMFFVFFCFLNNPVIYIGNKFIVWLSWPCTVQRAMLLFKLIVIVNEYHHIEQYLIGYLI